MSADIQHSYRRFGPFAEDAMLSFAQRLALQLPDKCVIYLIGDLGAGKTTFSRGLIQAWGHKGAVKSPTFTLLEPYQLAQRSVYHFDLYRLAEPEELDYIGAEEYFSSNSICLIEWPSCGEGVIPQADLVIELERIDSDSRCLGLTLGPALSNSLFDALTVKV